MNFQIRHANKNDLDEISTLSKNQLIEWGIDSSCWRTDILTKQIDKNFVLVATMNCKVIGYTAWINHELSDQIESKRVHITNTVIDPAHRRQGIAESIRKEMIGCCKEQNIFRITTNHHSSNKSIYNLSKKLGFSEYIETCVDKTCENDIFFEKFLYI